MVIHSSSSASGKFQVSRVNPATLAIMTTWTAPYGLKANYSNAFIACGVLYAIPNFWSDTTIDYAWEIGTSSIWDPSVSFDVVNYLTSAQYSSKDDTLYVYDNGNLVTMTPTWD
jgi:hypothetical protein